MKFWDGATVSANTQAGERPINHPIDQINQINGALRHLGKKKKIRRVRVRKNQNDLFFVVCDLVLQETMLLKQAKAFALCTCILGPILSK